MCCGGMILEEIPADEKSVARVMAHAGAPAQVSPEQNAALLDEETKNRILLAFKAYIWVDKHGNATCTRCGETFSMRYAAHKGYGRCRVCGTEAETRLMRYGRKRMNEEFYAVRWTKSAIDKNALVMTGYFCRVNYDCPDPGHAKKLIVPILIDTFRYGGGATRIQRCVWSYGDPEGLCGWSLRRDVRAVGAGYFGHRVDILRDERGFEAAIQGTPFLSAINTMNACRARAGLTYVDDRSELLSAIARRPWVEYVAKAGFERIALDALHGLPRELLLWRRKRVREILKLTPDRYAELRGKRANITASELEIFQITDAAGVKISLEEAQRLAGKVFYTGFRELTRLYGGVDRALIRYALKNDVRDLKDYWRMAREAGIDLSLPDARLPPDLTRAHDALVDQRRAFDQLSRIGRCEALQDRLDARLEKLERAYAFEFNGLILQPVQRLAQLIDEGNALHHCVSSYCQRYADGGTDICTLRRADAPDVPWRTIELSPKTHMVIQDRGFKNDRDAAFNSTMMPELKAELDAFWDAFYKNRGIEAGHQKAAV